MVEQPLRKPLSYSVTQNILLFLEPINETESEIQVTVSILPRFFRLTTWVLGGKEGSSEETDTRSESTEKDSGPELGYPLDG